MRDMREEKDRRRRGGEEHRRRLIWLACMNTLPPLPRPFKKSVCVRRRDEEGQKKERFSKFHRGIRRGKGGREREKEDEGIRGTGGGGGGGRGRRGARRPDSLPPKSIAI